MWVLRHLNCVKYWLSKLLHKHHASISSMVHQLKENVKSNVTICKEEEGPLCHSFSLLTAISPFAVHSAWNVDCLDSVEGRRILPRIRKFSIVRAHVFFQGSHCCVMLHTASIETRVKSCSNLESFANENPFVVALAWLYMLIVVPSCLCTILLLQTPCHCLAKLKMRDLCRSLHLYEQI